MNVEFELDPVCPTRSPSPPSPPEPQQDGPSGSRRPRPGRTIRCAWQGGPTALAIALWLVLGLPWILAACGAPLTTTLVTFGFGWLAAAGLLLAPLDMTLTREGLRVERSLWRCLNDLGVGRRGGTWFPLEEVAWVGLRAGRLQVVTRDQRRRSWLCLPPLDGGAGGRPDVNLIWELDRRRLGLRTARDRETDQVRLSAPRRCPFCHDELSEGVSCAACGAVHHGDCLLEHGACAVFGCGAGPGRARA